MKSTYWIFNPAYDVFFFATIWWVPLFLLLVLNLNAAIATTFLWVAYSLLLRLPHFVATLRTTYLKAENRAYYRNHWVAYFAVPAAIMGLYGAQNLLFKAGTLGPRLLLSVAIVWGLQHIGYQNYGILSIYRMRTQAPSDPVARRLEKLIIRLLIAAPVISTGYSIWFDAAALQGAAMLASKVIYAATALATAAYLARTFLKRASFPVSWPLLLFFATAAAGMTYWPIYERLGTPALPGTELFFYVYNAHHCICYLGLMFLIDSNYRGLAFTGRASVAGRYLRFLAPLLLGAAVLIFAGSGHFAGWVDGLVPRLGGFRKLQLLDGFFVLHYYLESRSWKLSNPHYRKTLGPLLKSPAFSGAGAMLARSRRPARAPSRDRVVS